MKCSICGRPLFARWHCKPSGNIVLLCRGHLDMWLDNADNEPALEPAKLEILGWTFWGNR